MKQRTVLESLAPEPTRATTDFDHTTAATSTATSTADDGRFDVELSPGWSALVGTHGGYLAAIASNVAERFAPDQDRRVRTVTTTFLRRGRPGPASARAHVVRHGRSVSTISVDLEQDDHVITSSRLTLAPPIAGAEWGASASLELPSPSACVRIQPQSPAPHFDRVDGLLDPASLPFTYGDRAIVQGYLRPIEPRPIDAAWLAMATDWFPPPAFVRVDPPLGGISVDLTTHVHRTIDHPQHDWLTGRFEIETSAGGLAVEHGVIRTLDGVLLAESFQTRWTAEG